MPWYQTWNRKFVDKTSSAVWTKCMSDERVITLEDRSAGWGTYAGIQSPTDITQVSQSQALYNLQGRCLMSEPSKGLYIKDGRKVVRK